MGLGSSLFLIAVGAVLRFAVTVNTHGINLQTVGLILLIVGGIGFIISLFMMTAMADRSGPSATGAGREIPPVQDPRF
jgi:Domain of unknown function (DUF6458)